MLDSEPPRRVHLRRSGGVVELGLSVAIRVDIEIRNDSCAVPPAPAKKKGKNGATVHTTPERGEDIQVQVLQGGLGVPRRHHFQGILWAIRPRLSHAQCGKHLYWTQGTASII